MTRPSHVASTEASSLLPSSAIFFSASNFIPKSPEKLAYGCSPTFVPSDMLTRRIIACLDVDDGRVVKGVQFVGLRDAGDPAELAKRHSQSGADEIVLLDISAAHQRRATLLETVRRTAKELFIPFTVGGGIRSLEDAAAVFAAGADKVSINSAALTDRNLIARIALRFGSQAVVVAIDAKRQSNGARWEAFTHGGRVPSGRDAVEWARES